jgi:hypothetical protein
MGALATAGNSGNSGINAQPVDYPPVFIPAMTSNNAPAPLAVAASNVLASYEPWRLFDGITVTDSASRWITNVGVTTGSWVSIDLGAVYQASSIVLWGGDQIGRNPRDWRLQVSTDGLEWVDVLTVESWEPGLSPYTAGQPIPFPEKTSRYWRIFIDFAWGTERLSVFRVELLP